jgi:hypothetical protein
MNVKMFDGKKTYLAAVGGALVSFALFMGWIDLKTAEAFWALCGCAGLAGLRDAVAKL